MRNETAITLLSQCRYNKNVINDTKSGKFNQVNIEYNSFPTGSRKYYFLHCGRHEIFTDWAKEQMQENKILFFIAEIFGKIMSNKKTSPQDHMNSQEYEFYSSEKKQNFCPILVSGDASNVAWKKQHKIKVVYWHDETVYTAIHERAAILNLIRTIIL